MKNIIHFKPLKPTLYEQYIEVGKQAYNEHYLHLWPKENSHPYIESSFTQKVLKQEETNSDTFLWLINLGAEPVGILKLTLNTKIQNYSKNETLYLDKVYLKHEATGKGIGKKTLQFVELRAKELNKKVIWLGAMQNGPALAFYLKNGYSIIGETELPFKEVLEKERPMFILIKEL